MAKQKLTSRRGERALAFQVLYGLSFTSTPSLEALRVAFRQSPHTPPAPQGFAWELVEGVWQHEAALNALITQFSKNWRIDRMGRVELTILRLALYELHHRKDIPPRVVINEALELAKQFGEDNARAFINGILDAAAKSCDAPAQ